MTQSTETDVAWDLSDLFAGPDDPAIDAALQIAKEWADDFAAAYQGRINSQDLTAARVRGTLAGRGQAGNLCPAAVFRRYRRPGAGSADGAGVGGDY